MDKELHFSVNAIGMTDIVAVGFNPRTRKLHFSVNAIGMTDIVAVGFNPRTWKFP